MSNKISEYWSIGVLECWVQKYGWFKKLQMPAYVGGTEQFARERGVMLAEVALEESQGDAETVVI